MFADFKVKDTGDIVPCDELDTGVIFRWDEEEPSACLLKLRYGNAIEENHWSRIAKYFPGCTPEQTYHAINDILGAMITRSSKKTIPLGEIDV